MNCRDDRILQRIQGAARLWLFLDYDGTLADFAPTPDHIRPDPDLIDLLKRLARHPRLRLTLISGRRLAHIRKLVPVPGLLLAGTYGVEMQTPAGEQLSRLEFDSVRPLLAQVQADWEQLLLGRKGFYLEDKGWAIALHAKFADAEEALDVLARARAQAEKALNAAAPGLFRLLGGHKFLEIGPTLAHKGRTVEYLLEIYPPDDHLLVYLGDDDKDEEAFAVVQARGGLALRVGDAGHPTSADCRLPSPQAARQWLAALPHLLAASAGISIEDEA